MQEACAATVNNGPNTYPIGAHCIIKNTLDTHNGWGNAVVVWYKTNAHKHDLARKAAGGTVAVL